MSISALAMVLLAMVSVGLWTLRVALAAAGRRVAGAAVAAVEAVVFALAFSQLVADLGSWDRLGGYAIGVALGTVGGLAVKERFDPGTAVVEVVVPGDGEPLREAFRSQGWPATSMPALGAHGPASVLFLVVHGNRTREVVRLVQATCPHALWTVRPATAAHGSLGQSTSVYV
jgi:uncharacterized protein YebE (UPF0316 family)